MKGLRKIGNISGVVHDKTISGEQMKKLFWQRRALTATDDDLDKDNRIKTSQRLQKKEQLLKELSILSCTGVNQILYQLRKIIKTISGVSEILRIYLTLRYFLRLTLKLASSHTFSSKCQSCHSKGRLKYFLWWIILTQRLCQRTIKIFRSIYLYNCNVQVPYY